MYNIYISAPAISGDQYATGQNNGNLKGWTLQDQALYTSECLMPNALLCSQGNG